MKKIVIAFAVAATAAAAFASPHARTAHRDGAAHFERFAEKLNLTDAQRQQIRDIRQADREQNKQLYADFRTKMQEFRAARRAGDANAAALRADLQPLREQIQAARKTTRQSILGVLTPEQRQQLEQWRGDHSRRRD